MPLGVDDRLTFLILGSDADATRISLGRSARTDAIILASIRSDGTGLVLASLPRDTVDIPLPDGRLWTSKVNALAPTLGIDIAREALEDLFGVEIDRYAQINMDDLIALVDEVGGVSVKVDHVLADAACTIPAGPSDLDGATALCFARHRYTDNDYARADRQQQLLLAIRDAILESGIAPPTLIAALTSLRTDVDASLLPQMVDLLAASSETTAHRLVFAPPQYTRFAGLAGERGWISQPDIPAIRAAVARLFADD